MESWQKNAVENIARAVAESGETQLSFSKNANVNKTHLNMVLKGKLPVTRQFVARIAEYTKRETDWFYADHAVEAPIEVQSNILEAIERGVAQTLAKAPSRVSAPQAEYGLSEDKLRLIEIIRNLPDARVRTLLDVLDVDSVAVASDEKNPAPVRRKR